MEIRPISLKEASDYINKNHRHNVATIGCKFCISIWEKDQMHGVAVCGRPISRVLDDGYTLEINRVCTDGKPNACSMLYGACCRIGKQMGYKKAITYTLYEENGASLKASNFEFDGFTRDHSWSSSARQSNNSNIPSGQKRRWKKSL